MTALKQMLDFVALGAPLYFAVAIFGLFSFLDKRASPKANTTISSWLRAGEYNKSHVADTLLEVFDRIYSRPLWGWRALIRSFIASAIATCLAIYWSYYVTFYFIFHLAQDGHYQFPLLIAGNFVADYLSLYVIRYWLGRGTSPIAALLLGPALAILVILGVYTIIDVVRFSLETLTFRPIYLIQGLRAWIETLSSFSISSRKSIFLGAAVVHAWLPLFAIGVVVARLLNSGRRAAIGVQWFLREGNRHPLQAIGFVAAIFTFVGSSLFQIFVKL
jgi:hypothetical protein